MNYKTPEEIRFMREGGRILAQTLDALEKAVKPGIKTRELEFLARDLIAQAGAKPSFLNYNGFPAALCVSVNDEIVHGVPSERVIKEGDLVKLDLGVLYKGFHTDSARTVLVGSGSHKELRSLIDVTREALEIGVAAAQLGKTTGDIGEAIHKFVKTYKLDVVRDLIGHGIGRSVHEAPEVPNYGPAGSGDKLTEGMVIAIEPMVVLGKTGIADGPDGFSYVTQDGKYAAHFEHTVAITNDGPLVLTSSEI